MTNRANADFFQILLRQLRQDALVDLVLAKASLVLLKAKASEPVAYIQWSLTLVGHDAGLCRPERSCQGRPALPLASPPVRLRGQCPFNCETHQRPPLSQHGALRRDLRPRLDTDALGRRRRAS
jgi:hypothetical protein